MSVVEPNEMQNVILPLIDRLIAPIVQRLDQMDSRQREDAQILHQKLDGVAGVSQRVHSVEGETGALKSRLDGIDLKQAEHAIQLARTQGRNDIIGWVLGLIGAPVVVTLVIFGISKVFNVELGL